MKRMKDLILAVVLVMSAFLQAFADIPAIPEPEKNSPVGLAWVLIALGVSIIVITVRWYKKNK